MRTVLDAVDEVGNPTILATFAVIAAILPMGFVRGLMGPYMRPIPVGGSLAMLFSLGVAFVVAPWAALRLLGHERGRAPDETRETWSTRTYRRIIRTLLRSGRARLGFLALVLALFAGAVALVGVGFVRVKMLPFDNKSEFQVFVDLPAGATREQSLAVGQQLGRVLLADPDVLGVQVHSLTPAPMTFVGMVRHTFLRGTPEQVDLAVQLVGKHARKRSSHEIATVLRPKLTAITAPLGARLRLVEIPPGPPVLATLVAEIYGPGAAARDGYAAQVRDAFLGTPGVVDVDSSLEAGDSPGRAPGGPRARGAPGREPGRRGGGAGPHPAGHRARHGADRSRDDAGPHRARALPGAPGRARRSAADPVQGERGAVPLETLVRPVEEGGAPRFHKNLMPVSYVLAELSGSEESPVYALMALNRKLDALRPHGEAVPRYGLSMPPDTERLAMKWDGEWHITLEVFRDLGLAFAAVLVLIYLLVVGWFDSFVVPLGGAPAHPPEPHRDPPGPRAARCVLHRDQHDRLHRRRGDHRPQQHHPRRLHPPEDRRGDAARGGGGGGRRRPLPADAAHRGGGGGRERGDAGRPHLPGPRHQHDGRRGGGHAALADCGAGALHGPRAAIHARPRHPGRGPRASAAPPAHGP